SKPFHARQGGTKDDASERSEASHGSGAGHWGPASDRAGESEGRSPSEYRMRIALVSPKGPLYRHRGGIFRRSLRYAPLTLTTLASLVPPELDAEIELIDEGIQDVDRNLQVDLVGITVITGTAPRAYELSAALRARGLTVVLG